MRGLSDLCRFASTVLMGHVCSAARAHQEEQETAEEESARCIESLPINTLRSLISLFDKAVMTI